MQMLVIVRLTDLCHKVLVHPGAVHVFNSLLKEEPGPGNVAPASPVFSSSQDAERMVWAGFKGRAVTAQLHQGLEGGTSSEKPTAGECHHTARYTSGAPRGLDSVEALADPERMRGVGGPTNGHQSPKGEGAKGPAAGVPHYRQAG
jgi:hypothetical protein